MALISSRDYTLLAFGLVVLISIGHAVNAEHGKKNHPNKHSDQKEHELHHSRKEVFEKPHKKAEIDFSSSEFADTDSSDDGPDDGQSEKVVDKEQSDYDDNEAEDPEFTDSDDNEVTDLSDGEAVQSEEEEMSFDDEGSQNYDDYDEDEDSAAEQDDDDSDANFTESDDEEVMSDISHINDYSEEIDQQDEESEDSEEASDSNESFIDEALEEADNNIDESDDEDASSSPDDAELMAEETDNGEVEEDSTAENDEGGENADQSELEAEYEEASKDSDNTAAETAQDDTAVQEDASSNAPSEQASGSSSAPQEPAPSELQGEKRGEIASDDSDELAATPQTVLAKDSANEKVDEDANGAAEPPKNDNESTEATTAVEDDSSAPTDSAPNDDAVNSTEDSNTKSENAKDTDASSSKSTEEPPSTAEDSANTYSSENATADASPDEAPADFSSEDEGGDLDDEDDIADDNANSDDSALSGNDGEESASPADEDSAEDAGEVDDEDDMDDAPNTDDDDDDFEAADELNAEDDTEDSGEETFDDAAVREDISEDDLNDDAGSDIGDDSEDGEKNSAVEPEAPVSEEADTAEESITAEESNEDSSADDGAEDDKEDVEEEPNPEEYFDTEDEDEDDDVPLSDCEPEEAEVRTFRGILTGQTRGFLSGVKNMARKVFRRRRPRLSRPRRRPRPSKNKLLLTGRKPPALGLKMSAWNSKLMAWDWKRFVRFRSSGSPAHAAFLVDASIRSHMGIMQRLSYSLARVLPIRSSYYTIASFGKGYNQVSSFQRYANAQQLQAAMAQIKADNTRSRRTGEAMEQAVRIFAAAKTKSPGLKQVLFIFVRGRSFGCIYKIQSASKALRQLGVRVYIIGFGTRLLLEELTMMTKPSMIFRATTYAHLIKGIAGRPGILPRLANRLIRWLDGGGGVWYHSSWNWYKYVKGLKYGACGKANVGFLVDTSSPPSRKFIQKLVYNYIRLFQLQGTTVTIYAYGPTQRRVCDWRGFESPADIQGVINSIPIIPGGYRKTGQAMAEIFKRFEIQRRRNGLPNILFVITTGATSDGDMMKPIGERYRGKGIKVWGYGVNPKAKKFVDELKNIATNPSYVIYGPKRSLITPERFTAIQELIKQDSGKGSSITIHIGNKKTLKIQKTWEWPKAYKGIQYGAVNKANIAFLVEGFFPRNLGYIRKFIYNIIRTFKLSGTYVTLMDYGDAQYRVANWVQLRNGADVRRLVRKLPKSNKPARRTGLALQAALNTFSTAPAGNLNILILITKGKSSDDVVIPAANLRKKGIKTLAVGLTGFNPRTNLGDKGFKQREISLIPFSSSQIFAGRIDGLLPLSGIIMQSLQKLVGKPSPSSGSSGKIDVSPTDFVYEWYWKTTTNNLISYGLNPVNIVVIMDGASRKHLDILGRLTFNIVRLFGPASNVAFVVFGATVDPRFATWKNYIGLGPLQRAVSSLSYRGTPGRRVGPAIDTAIKLFSTAPNKAGKKIAIVILTGRPQDNPTGPGQGLKKIGVVPFNIGLVPLTPAILKPILPGTTFVVNWKQLPDVVAKIRINIIKVVGPIPGEKDTGTQPKPPTKPPVDPPRPPPTDSGIGCKGSKDIEKLRSTWDWNKIINGIKYESFNPAELIFVVDVTEDNNFDITVKFLYNIVRIFKLGTVRISFVSFGRRPRLRFISKPMRKIRQIQNILTRIKARSDKKTNVGKALEFVRTRVTSRMKTNIPKVVVLITQGGSDDNVVSPSRKLKGSGVIVVSVGIGDSPQEIITTTASTGDLALQSPFSKLPAIVVRIQYGLTMPINGPPTDRTIDPENSGEGGKDSKDQDSTTSIPDETSGKPDPGKPGGPSTSDPGEGGRGGATGDTPNNSGGTDTGAGGGATGTNVTPVGPKKPVPKPKPPKKPDTNAGGPGTPGGKEEEKPNVEGPNGKKPGEPGTPGAPGTPGTPGAPGTPGTPSGGQPSTPGGGTTPEVEEPTDGKRPEKVKPGKKEPGIGDKEKEKGGDKISGNTGVNPGGGVVNPNTENGGENTGPIKPIVIGGDDDKEDPVTGGIQVIDVPTDLLSRLPTQWNWEKAINNFGYNTIAPSRVGFIVDGHTPANFELIKHYIFNIARFFNIRKSTFTIVQFGKTPVRIITQDKRVICPAELRIECDKMKPDTGGTNIGPAIAAVQKLFGVRRRGPSVLFIITQSRLSGNVNSFYATIKTMRAAGTKIFSIGVGGSYDLGQVQGLAGNDKNSYASLLPSMVAGSMMNLQFWCLRNIGAGNKLGRYFMKQGLVAQIGRPRPKPTPGKGIILKIQIVATGCDDAPAKGNCANAPASIKVNGIERSLNRRGLNIAVFDLGTGRFEGSVNFDTHGNRMAVKQMVSYIDKIKPNRLVLVASRDSYTRLMNSRAYSALYSIGGEEPFAKSTRSSYALLGFKGKQKASWTKQVALKRGKGPATISAQMMAKRVRDEPLKTASEFGTSVCQGRVLAIGCPVGLKIGILYAMFGRQNRDNCKHKLMSNINCKSPRSLKQVKRRCEGRRSCKVAASSRIFGNPCGGTFKYLEVKWTCRGMKTPAPATRPALKIDITAMGCNDPPAKGRCGASVGSIKVNGKEVSLNKRGINIVCIRYPKGKIIRRKNYDTYGSRANSVLLLKLIRRIPSNTIVLVSTRDSYNAGFTSSAQTALRMIGGRGNLNMGLRGSLAMIGFKGRGTFGWKKQIARRAGKGPSVISETINLPFKVIMPRPVKRPYATGLIAPPKMPRPRPKPLALPKPAVSPPKPVVPPKIIGGRPPSPRFTGNIARGKPTKQSSTLLGALSSRAVDGNANGAWAAKSFALTNIQTNPWWRVDLRNPKANVVMLKITSMRGCTKIGGKTVCPASWVDVRIGNVNNNPRANALCTVARLRRNGRTVSARCRTQRRGRFVYIMSRARKTKTALAVAEVQVFAFHTLTIPKPAVAPVGTFGGNARGAKCVFPFRYKGKIYKKCTKVNHNKLWCSTTANYDKDKKWGNCRTPAKREEIEEPIFEDDDEDDSDEYDDSEFKSTTCDVVD